VGVKRPAVVKLGGELVEEPRRLRAIARVLAATAARRPLVVVHGGGREIDRALARAGIEKRQVDGIRITDPATLDVVVQVLAGAVNTRLVAAITALGGRAVGLTGADDALGLSVLWGPQPSGGRPVRAGLVGRPVGPTSTRLLECLMARGYLPVVASIGLARDGRLLNVNADVLAGHLAARLRAARLVIAGATAGVLDDRERTIPRLDVAAMRALTADGTASAGMVAKLGACEQALSGGVAEVVVADGRRARALEAAVRARRGAASLPATWIVN